MCHCQLFPYYDDTLPPASSSLAALCVPLRLRRHDKPVHEPAASGEGRGYNAYESANIITRDGETIGKHAGGPGGIRRALHLLGDKFFFPVDKSWWQCVVSSKTALFFPPCVPLAG